MKSQEFQLCTERRFGIRGSEKAFVCCSGLRRPIEEDGIFF